MSRIQKKENSEIQNINIRSYPRFPSDSTDNFDSYDPIGSNGFRYFYHVDFFIFHFK